ncbi:AAA family ATPase [Actinosynnema sp. NPDC020468]|uniref:AAA family ATPase n=1 Tax=Actinosynnema sp. NPDC020468 TaxID=3154488 RepID=UPI0033C45824
MFGLSVADAAPLFADDARSRRAIGALPDVGLGRLAPGRPSPTLSGGEAQRVKLAKQPAMTRPAQLVHLDEPTTGLHPDVLPQLVEVFRSLVDRGCTVVVVEHNPEVVAVADQVVEVGPGGGPDGGRIVHCGPPRTTRAVGPRPRAVPRPGRPTHDVIRVRGASANSLRDLSADFPKQRLTAVVGVSGSGKSSLVRDVLEVEATRRLLECLSVCERQSVKEGPRARVESVVGLGPTIAIGPRRQAWNPRGTVGTSTGIGFHLGVLPAHLGARECPSCGGEQRRAGVRSGSAWTCAGCGVEGPPADPGHFAPATDEAACPHCRGTGTAAVPRVERRITRPGLPICAGALHSPGFYPRSYPAKPANVGYWMLREIGARYGFDPETTPWTELTEPAREAFLFGEEDVTLPAEATRSAGRTVTWRGVFRIVDGWDVGGLYTERVPCPACAGGRSSRPCGWRGATGTRCTGCRSRRSARRSRARRCRPTCRSGRAGRSRSCCGGWSSWNWSGSGASASTGRPARCPRASRSGSGRPRCSAPT